ncbi:hypothetical protein DPMN_166783 [Dreissena polymorpha]|uniref:E3 ubiquitin-protein ligase n=1 Tax=Dreissena polymorpha TaxID=45954 RepID=A0A9D4F241_DREPO|nr:hypothetical protein DPMN_166783 [Dreissena polymorpha]
MVKDAHQVWVEDPSKLDFQNANHYVAATPVASKSILKKTASSTSKGGPASNPAVIKIIKETTTKMKKKKMICSLPIDVTLFVYEGSVLDMEAPYDAITCPCEGVLSDLIANEVGKAYYEKQLEAFRDKDEGAIFSIKGKGDKLSNTRIVHIVHKRSHFDDSAQSLNSLSWRTEKLLHFLNNSYKCVTLPCLLPGKIQDLRRPVKNFVQEILDFCVTKDDVNIKEIHVVDTNPTIVKAITSEIRSICTSPQAQKGVLNGANSASNYGWTKHTSLELSDAKASVTFDAKAASATSTTDSECPICSETVRDFVTLPCNHQLCKKCTDNIKKVKPQCPFCSKTFGTVTGNQPPADMYFRSSPYSLPGYDECSRIEIVYDVPAGKQTPEHPRPGRSYDAVRRRAFLPDNEEGRRVLHLLRRAFDRRLIFTIGESRTSGMEGVVTWNDIHHKTRPYGGPEGFGYPDPTYLQRVQEELAAKGVNE